MLRFVQTGKSQFVDCILFEVEKNPIQNFIVLTNVVVHNSLYGAGIGRNNETGFDIVATNYDIIRTYLNGFTKYLFGVKSNAPSD